MRPILTLGKVLPPLPSIPTLPAGTIIRAYRDLRDAEAWAALQSAAFDGLLPVPRVWRSVDFAQRFLDRPNWRPEHLLLAEAQRPDGPAPIGTVMLGLEPRRSWGSLRWLAVHPAMRRKGIARALVLSLETQAVREGLRELRLDTLASWSGAVAFYTALGYAPVAASSSPAAQSGQ